MQFSGPNSGSLSPQYRCFSSSNIKTFDAVHDICAISGYRDIAVFRYRRHLSISHTICHTWCCWAQRPLARSSPADRSRLLVLEDLDPLGQSVPLRDCLHALSCSSTRHTPRNVVFSCLILLHWPGPGMDSDGWLQVVGSPDFKSSSFK